MGVCLRLSGVEIMIWMDKRWWVVGGVGVGKLGIILGFKVIYKIRVLEFKRWFGGVRKGFYYFGFLYFFFICIGCFVLIWYFFLRGFDMI